MATIHNSVYVIKETDTGRQNGVLNTNIVIISLKIKPKLFIKISCLIVIRFSLGI